MSIQEAARKWVNEFNAIPQSILVKLVNIDPDEVEELTPFTDEEFDDLLDFFPMWSTLWSMTDSTDIEWLEGHLQEMKDCGFRIYRQEDYGYIFGIDGCGYDFYEAHWIPLYQARGLKWHE